MYFQHRAFKDLEQIVGNDTTVFQDWLKHPEVDAHLKQLELDGLSNTGRSRFRS